MKPGCFIGVSRIVPKLGWVRMHLLRGGRFPAVAIASVFPVNVLLVGTLAFIRYYRVLYRQRQLHPTVRSDDLTCPMSMFPTHTELRKRKISERATTTLLDTSNTLQKEILE